jgi:aspartate aminotransferase
MPIMKLASRVSRISPSPTLSVTAEAKAMAERGMDVIDFASGEPDFDTPDSVKDAAIAAIRSGFTKYTATGGIKELKQAVVDKLKRDHNLAYDTSQVLISCGAKHTLYNIAEALFEAGDEVIIPSPYWVSYPDQVRLHDAVPIVVRTTEETGFQLTADLLEEHVTARTKAVILNSPGNPTGGVYERATLEAIANVALGRNLLIISDEIYEKILYDNVQHVSIASLDPTIQAKTIVVNGVSKAYSMTGWRIGYAAGPEELMVAMGTLQSQSTSNPNSIAQKAAVAALQSGDLFPRQMVAEFDKRRRFMVERLNKIPGIQCRMPQGAFYAFPNIEKLIGRRSSHGIIESSSALVAYLLKDAGVATVAGEGFGAPSHIRFSYATGMPKIAQGLDRIEAAILRLS